MLCDLDRDLGAVLYVDVQAKVVSAFLYFPIENEEKQVIGYNFYNLKDQTFDIKTSNCPFIYNFDQLINTSFLGDKVDCDSWGVYAEWMEDTAVRPPMNEIKDITETLEFMRAYMYADKYKERCEIIDKQFKWDVS